MSSPSWRAAWFQTLTDDGYLDVGPKNNFFCHFYTDLTKFYFNSIYKPIWVNIYNLS